MCDEKEEKQNGAEDGYLYAPQSRDRGMSTELEERQTKYPSVEGTMRRTYAN